MGRCKKHSHLLPDVNTKGKPRRWSEAPSKLVSVLLLDGPLAGKRVMRPSGADYITVGLIRYSYAGKMKRVPAYARVPKTYAARRIMLDFIARTGRDPRLVFDRKGQRRDTA